MANDEPFSIPNSCPYTISRLDVDSTTSSSTWLIREHDQYGEYPHIYAKICRARNLTPSISSHDKYENKTPSFTTSNDTERYHDKVIILSDTGCGTETPNAPRPAEHIKPTASETSRPEPEVWNLGTFLEYTLNPGGRIPYLVMTTHCHYDHIMGLWKLPATDTTQAALREESKAASRILPATTTTVLSSAYRKSFVTPYANLQDHSLCDAMRLHAPRYTVRVWAEDMQRVVYTSSSGSVSSTSPSSGLLPTISIPTPLTILHTPGHTPDSLAWYDAETRVICVGDSFYLKQTMTTRAAPWGPEPPMPTMFSLESDLAEWWASTKKILAFVRMKNNELEVERDDAEYEGFVLVDKNKECRHNASVPQGQAHPRPWYCRWKAPSPSDAQTGFSHFPGYLKHDCLLGDAADTASRILYLDEEGGKADYVRLESDTFAHNRVRLCAAHTTVSVDAEAATLAIISFMAGILRDEVPCRRVADGRRGEERWLWDYALDNTPTDLEENDHIGCQIQRENRKLQERSTKGTKDGLEYRDEYSALAPLRVIEEGRRSIPRSEWEAAAEVVGVAP